MSFALILSDLNSTIAGGFSVRVMRMAWWNRPPCTHEQSFLIFFSFCLGIKRKKWLSVNPISVHLESITHSLWSQEIVLFLICSLFYLNIFTTYLLVLFFFNSLIPKHIPLKRTFILCTYLFIYVLSRFPSFASFFKLILRFYFS